MYAIVDIETTGGSAEYHRITEICIVVHDGEKVVDKFHSLINPERGIPSNISLLTGITNEMVQDAPKFYEVAKEIFLFTQDKIFVAHNVNFDFNFIKKEFEALGGEFRRKKLCTVRLSRKLIPGLPSYSLGNLCESIGIELHDRHRAHGDAQATAELFTRLLKQPDATEYIQYSLKRGSKEMTLPPNISREVFEALPEKTGVYYFHDVNGNVIYVGKAKNIKERVGDHFAGNTHTKYRQLFLHSIYDVSYEVTGNELIALLLENEEIKKYYPRYNKANKTFVLNFGYYVYEDQNGYLRLSIGKTGKRDKPIRTFKSFSEAFTEALLKVKKNNLCLRLCSLIEIGSCTYHVEEKVGHLCPVCQKNQKASVYNKRFMKTFMEDLDEDSFIIKTKGRSKEEEGFVMVERGKFLGYGYVSTTEEVQHVNDLKNYIRGCYDTQDSQMIIHSFLKKSKLISDDPWLVYKCR